MRISRITVAFALATVMACDDTLSLSPTSEVLEEDAIVDAGSARAALAGAYNALQSGDYYGGSFVLFTDMMSPDVEHTGTFSSWAAGDNNALLSDNEEILPIYEALYAAVGVANQLIARVPNVPGMDDEERDDIIGQAHFIRALSFHNLVKLWGPIALPLTPPDDINEASNIQRSPIAQVYQQILSDLTQAEALISSGDTRKASADAAVALRSRVQLHQGNWQAVIDAANSLEGSYTLASNYSDLFSPDGNSTPEDIFRVSFTAVEFNLVGFYYLSRSFGGRWEVAPTFDLIEQYGQSYDPTFDVDTVQTTNDDGDLIFNPGDPRAAWGISFDARDRNYGSKIPTPIGAEDIHVIRFAEVILNKAEALAQRNQPGDLLAAITEVNRIRGRVGVPAINAVGLTQAQVLNIIYRERRLELAMEGFAWVDLVRTGRAQAVMGSAVAAHEVLWPIPQPELDVSPQLTQNPGY